MSTDHRPIHRSSIDQLSTNYRRSVGEVSVNEKLYRPRHIWNDYRPTIDRYVDRLSTECRPSIDRVSTESRPSLDRVSTECRPSVDRLSTECRPTIDRVSTAISTAISTNISVNITHSKQDPNNIGSKIHPLTLF